MAETDDLAKYAKKPTTTPEEDELLKYAKKPEAVAPFQEKNIPGAPGGLPGVSTAIPIPNRLRSDLPAHAATADPGMGMAGFEFNPPEVSEKGLRDIVAERGTKSLMAASTAPLMLAGGGALEAGEVGLLRPYLTGLGKQAVGAYLGGKGGEYVGRDVGSFFGPKGAEWGGTIGKIGGGIYGAARGGNVRIPGIKGLAMDYLSSGAAPEAEAAALPVIRRSPAAERIPMVEARPVPEQIPMVEAQAVPPAEKLRYIRSAETPSMAGRGAPPAEMHPEELADIRQQAGRPELTPEEAHRFRINRLAEQAASTAPGNELGGMKRAGAEPEPVTSLNIPERGTMAPSPGLQPIARPTVRSVVDQAMGVKPLERNMPLREQMSQSAKEELSRPFAEATQAPPVEDPIKVKYPDPAVRKFVRANGEALVDAVGDNQELLQEIHNLKNVDVREAAINAGIDLGTKHVGQKLDLGPEQVSRQELLEQILQKGFKPADIPDLAKPKESAKP